MDRFTTDFALLVLDGKQTGRMSNAKRALLRSIKASETVSSLLEKGPVDSWSLDEIKEAGEKMKKEASSLNAKCYEKELVAELVGERLLDDVPSILGCDIDYYTAGIDIYEYRSDEKRYSEAFTRLRKASLAPGNMDDESFLMVWLLRECSLYEIVDDKEKSRVFDVVAGFIEGKEKHEAVWNLKIRNAIESAFADIIRKKQMIMQNEWAQGVAMFLPNVEKHEGIFVDFVVLGTNPSERLAMLVDFVREKGHDARSVVIDGDTLVKIDNRYYRLFPTTRTYRLPVQGVNLIPDYSVIE